MKIQIALISAFVILTGCASSQPLKVITKGPLICEADEVCPELAMRWNEETRNGFKITTEINNPEQFDIKQLVFLVDGQPYAYSTISPTAYTTTGHLKTSTNSIHVPVSFLNSFRDGKEINLKLVTDKGEINRPILKANGQKSSAYVSFLKGYTGQMPQ
ncbi:hypothetical protein [Acinetobacter sp. ANC 4648]|uniref:hypothetical protein n=1 Tax=Acinetobacter sp. ANC 4648 TaxID=1977875 RepID=UPI000A35BA0F|nr:hypothetical protein [Acinetobacter sp. ANC 4648]OTG82846.1 hypothetical protein B9T27_06120 [Acinetobacter sp. ANC 4648]